jgi:hypothetical protein
LLLIGQLMYVLLILLQCHVWHLTMQPMSSLGKIPLDCLCSSNATVEWASFWLHRRLHHSQCHDYCHFHSDRPPGDHSIWVIPNSPSIDMGLLQGLSLYPGKIMQPKIKEFFYRLCTHCHMEETLFLCCNKLNNMQLLCLHPRRAYCSHHLKETEASKQESFHL